MNIKPARLSAEEETDLLLMTGLVSAFFLDAINKRFFWNAIIISLIMLENYEATDSIISVWPSREDVLAIDKDNLDSLNDREKNEDKQ